MSRILNESQIVMICEMRERGLSYQQIANKVKSTGTATSASNIAWICLTRGADLPAERRRIANYGHTPGSIRKRGDHLVRQFSSDEDRILKQLDMQGLRICEISRQMNRRPNSIRGRLASLARQVARAEE